MKFIFRRCEIKEFHAKQPLITFFGTKQNKKKKMSRMNHEKNEYLKRVRSKSVLKSLSRYVLFYLRLEIISNI